jgi:ATPase subunit of ABC transporter with duplicated ATPase domains
MATLSGGQKTRVFLAGIIVNRPEIVLLDEPSNHLDSVSRSLLYEYIKSTTHAIVVVSHDRTLLNLIDTVHELGSRGITVYGGNYDFYAAQKKIEAEALDQDLRSKEKLLRKAKETERESLQRQQKLDARGKKKQEKAGLPTISMNTFRNNAEKSTSRIKDVHAEKVENIFGELNKLRASLPDMDKMKMGFDHSAVHKGKVLITATDVNFGYDDHLLWKEGLSFQVRHGERIAIKGRNGSGKTTLIKMILGELRPRSGTVDSFAVKTLDSIAVKTIDQVAIKTIYIDQDYSLIDDRVTVVEQVERFNSGILQDYEIKTRLNRFLFTKDWWDKPCGTLSGGEKMRLILCSLTVSDQAPDMIILDEPTNNLDMQNIEILTAAIRDYKGTLLVISHDEYFEKQIKVERSIHLI